MHGLGGHAARGQGDATWGGLVAVLANCPTAGKRQNQVSLLPPLARAFHISRAHQALSDDLSRPGILEPPPLCLPPGISVQTESREGRKLETLSCLEREQPGLGSSQSVLVPAAKTAQPGCLCSAVPQLQEVSGSRAQSGVLMPLRMQQKEEWNSMSCFCPVSTRRGRHQ